MVQRVVVELTSDLSGETAQESVLFTLDGVSYEIDLTTDEAAELRDALGRYTAAGRRVGRSGATSKSSRRTANSGYDASAVREWATANGVEVSERGRISKSVLEQYQAAGN